MKNTHAVDLQMCCCKEETLETDALLQSKDPGDGCVTANLVETLKIDVLLQSKDPADTCVTAK